MTAQPAPVVRDDFEQFQRDVSDWQDRTFPNATILTVIAHLSEEISELEDSVFSDADCIDSAEEAADCLLLLIGLANHCGGFSLFDAARQKFERNQQRAWGTVTEAGYTKHTEEAPHAE